MEPEGVVAKPNVPERELAVFNIGMAVWFFMLCFFFLSMIMKSDRSKQDRNFRNSNKVPFVVVLW